VLVRNNTAPIIVAGLPRRQAELHPDMITALLPVVTAMREANKPIGRVWINPHR